MNALRAVVLLSVFSLTGCAGLAASSGPPPAMRPGVVQFDLSQLDPDGKRPDAGFQPLTYEMCVPSNPDATGSIESIDRTARCHEGQPGRIGCKPDEALCVGNTGQSNWAAVLAQLSNVPFVNRIVDSGLPTPPEG